MRRKQHLNWYPDPTAILLKNQISKYAGVKPSEVLVTNGSDQAHELICNTFLEEGDEVLVLAPTYSNFLIWVESRGARVKKFQVSIGEEFNVRDFLNTANSKTKLVYLIHPYIITPSEKDIAAISKSLPSTVVVVDEAYFEFYGKSCMNLIRNHDNLIVTRSFSKALFLAGLRLGYICSNQDNIRSLSKIHNFKSVNAIAQLAGVEILKNTSYVKNYTAEAKMSKKLLVVELPKLNFEIVPTDAGLSFLDIAR
jgi:histidinol-phosphate aminotransferase